MLALDFFYFSVGVQGDKIYPSPTVLPLVHRRYNPLMKEHSGGIIYEKKY